MLYEVITFVDAAKTADNLKLIHSFLENPALPAALVETARQTADPDLALNSLERLVNIIDKSRLNAVLDQPESCRLLLTTLGASPFLTSILCRRAGFFDDLFIAREIHRRKDQTIMLAELRERLRNNFV